MEHMPSASFRANSAWLQCAVLAHNLIRWTATLGQPGPVDRLTVARTVRVPPLTSGPAGQPGRSHYVASAGGLAVGGVVRRSAGATTSLATRPRVVVPSAGWRPTLWRSPTTTRDRSPDPARLGFPFHAGLRRTPAGPPVTRHQRITLEGNRWIEDKFGQRGASSHVRSGAPARVGWPNSFPFCRRGKVRDVTSVLLVVIVWTLGMWLALSLCAVAKEADSQAAQFPSVRKGSKRRLSAVR